jgi:hypothetical protein
MMRTAFLLAGLVAVVGSGTAAGQTKEIQDGVERRLADVRAAGRTAEHIEIFRRLLNRGLLGSFDASLVAPENCPAFLHSYSDLGYYQPALALINKARSRLIDPMVPGASQEKALLRWLGSEADPNAPLSSVHGQFGKMQLPALAEGVRLPGRGVVFTATLPMPPKDPLAAAEKPADKPLTAWEQERRALRGETDKPVKAESRAPSLSETILRLLAENGKHFTELGPDEEVTVAVVFRPGKLLGGEQCILCHQASPHAMWKYWYNTDPQGTDSKADPGRSGGERPAKSVLVDPEKPAESVVDLFRNGLALGDLNLKQGKPREAVKIYRELIDKCGDTLEALEKLPAESSRAERVHVVRVGMEAYAKLAQAQVALGENDAVLKMLKEWEAFSHKFVQLAASPKTQPEPKTPPSPLPTRLTISAPKKLLDQVGAGKISFDEFRKTATIEYQDGKP